MEWPNLVKKFANRSNKYYEGDIVDLKEHYRISEDQAIDGIPTVFYDIIQHETGEKVGSIDLRLKMNDYMYYYGHIGYNVKVKHRGHSYAYEACRLLFKIAKEEFMMHELIITCCPENIPSYKTLRKLDGKLIEIIDVPSNHELFFKNEKTKCVFRYRL